MCVGGGGWGETTCQCYPIVLHVVIQYFVLLITVLIILTYDFTFHLNANQFRRLLHLLSRTTAILYSGAPVAKTRCTQTFSQYQPVVTSLTHGNLVVFSPSDQYKGRSLEAQKKTYWCPSHGECSATVGGVLRDQGGGGTAGAFTGQSNRGATEQE